jgi:uncharacterized protein (DUF302 family)
VDTAPIRQWIASERGIVRIRSCHSVTETMERLTALLKGRGILIFAHVRFSYDAARAGLPMPPEELLIFGALRFSAPLIQAAPTAGLDLPSKALAWQDKRGQTWVAYNDPEYVLQRHALPAEWFENLATVIPYIQQAASL